MSDFVLGVCGGADVGSGRLCCKVGMSRSSVNVAGLFRGLSWVCGGLWALDWVVKLTGT